MVAIALSARLPCLHVSTKGRQNELSTDEFARWWRETGENELRQLLFWRWGPLSVASHFPNTVDEYDGYAPQLIQVLRTGASVSDVAAHLASVERNEMGLPVASVDRLRTVAALVHAWFEISQDSWADRPA